MELEAADLESIAQELERRAEVELARWSGRSDDLLAADRHWQARENLREAANRCREAYQIHHKA